MRDVVILTLAEHDAEACECHGRSGASARVPVLTCADALTAAGATVAVVTAGDDAAIDATMRPVADGQRLLVIAAATDGEVRAVIRRLVRRLAPPPSKRPEPLPPDRTMFDLPAVAVLPLLPAVPKLVTRLGLPTAADAVAGAVAGGRIRRLDLLRTDSGSATLHGAVVGAAASGQPETWHGRVEVDDHVLSSGEEPLLACAVGNAGPSYLDGLPLIIDAAPDDGAVEVAIAIPVLRRRLLRGAEPAVEVRRASGRAVSVTPRDDKVPFLDDGVAGTLTHKRAWWVERGAWALFVS